MTNASTPSGIEFVRTPDDRFADLADFAYEPHYFDIEGSVWPTSTPGPPLGPSCCSYTASRRGATSNEE